MACNAMVWALVGLSVLSFSMAQDPPTLYLSVQSAPADGGQENQAAAPAAAPADGPATPAPKSTDGGQENQAAAPADGPATPAPKSNPLAAAIYEIIGIFIQTVLDNAQLGGIFQRFPEKTRTAIIEKISQADRNKAITDNVNPSEVGIIIKGLTDEQGNAIFDDFDSVKNQSPDDQLKSVLNLSAGGLAKLAQYDPKGLLGNIIKAIPANQLGKIAVENLDAIVKVLKVEDIKTVIRAIVKYFLQD